MFLEDQGPCIAACYACATLCERCAVACLEIGHDTGVSRCVTLSLDCAQMCRTAAALLSRRSDFSDTVCSACADLCVACAAAARRQADSHCRQCADACERCAALCRQIVDAGAATASFA